MPPTAPKGLQGDAPRHGPPPRPTLRTLEAIVVYVYPLQDRFRSQQLPNWAAHLAADGGAAFCAALARGCALDAAADAAAAAAAAAEPPPLLRVLVLDGVYNDAAAMFRHLRKRGCAPPHVGLHPNTLSVYRRVQEVGPGR